MRRVLAISAFAVCGIVRADDVPDDAARREAAVLDWQEPRLLAVPWSDAPGATTVITAEEIERSGAANIFDLLRRVPGVDIRYTPMGGHISIRSNGSSPFSEEVLMLIDGSPYNSPDKGGFPGHPNYTGFFPLDRISRIEVIRGPISVIYGANAFGGVVNIVSKQAADAMGDRAEGTTYGGKVVAGNEDIAGARGNFGWVSASSSVAVEAGVLRGNTPIRMNGDAEHERGDVYVSGALGGLWGSVLHQESKYGSFSFEGLPTIPAHNNVDIADLHYDVRAGRAILRASATLNRYRGTTCANCHNNQSGPPDDAVTSDVGSERETDSRVRVALRSDITLSDRQDLNAGLELFRDEVERRIVVQAGAEHELDGGGAFVQHQWHARSGQFHLLTGLRVDTLEGLDAAVSPRVAAVIEPNADLSVHVSWSRAYRAPTWNERFIRQRFLPFDLAPNLILVIQGNPDLDRERIDSAQSGAAWRVGGRTVLRVDLYANRVYDFIYRANTVFVPGTPNEIRQPFANKTEPFSVRGGEATVLTRPVAPVALMFAYAYRGLSLGYGDGAAAYAPRHRLYGTVDWTPAPRWSVNVGASWSSSYTVSSPNVFGLRPQPGYSLYDAALHYSLPVGRGRVLLGLDGHNLTDEHPYETLVGPGIDTGLRGRIVTVGATLEF